MDVYNCSHIPSNSLPSNTLFVISKGGELTYSRGFAGDQGYMTRHFERLDITPIAVFTSIPSDIADEVEKSNDVESGAHIVHSFYQKS